MKYITDNDTLLRYIPNVIAAVEGENTLFHKIQPRLQQAEDWMQYTILSPEAWQILGQNADHQAWEFARIAVAAEAFRAAVPALDLILTNNGFGIVSNQSVAPASKDRVAALIAALVEERDSAVEHMARTLEGKGHVLGGRIYAGYNLQRAMGQDNMLLQHFFAARQQEHTAERFIAEQVVSEALMEQLRTRTWSAADTPLLPSQSEEQGSRTSESEEKNTMGKLQTLVRWLLLRKMENALTRKDMAEVVAFIRNNTTVFPGWETSEAAAHWRDMRYTNNKQKGGIWL